jgi:hypothetical protein
MTIRLSLLAGALALAGCQLPPGPHAPDFGDAVRHNMEAQMVDPDAGTTQAEAPEMDGRRAVGAVGRYRTGTVIPPRELRLPGVGN